MNTTIWTVECGDYEQAYIAAAFTTKEAAEDYAERNDGTVDELTVHDAPIAAAPHWHFGADVYPDGTVNRWDSEHVGNDGDVGPVDDHLNARDEPWDGHTQGHCGFHISLFGSDRALIEQRREETITRYLALCDGTCRGCGRTDNYITGFWDTQPVDVHLVGGPSDGDVHEEQMPKPHNPTEKPRWWGGVLVMFSLSFKEGEHSTSTNVSYTSPEWNETTGRWERRFNAQNEDPALSASA